MGCTLARASANVTPEIEDRPRIGVEPDGVLHLSVADMPSSVKEGEVEWWASNDSVVPDALWGMRRLVQKFGVDKVFVVGITAKSEKRERQEAWLRDALRLCEQTGLVEANICFCERRTGREGLGVLAKRLRLSHFVGASFACLEAVFGDSTGNALDFIDRFNGRLIHFARSAKEGRAPQALPHMAAEMEKFYSPTNGWQQTVALLERASILSLGGSICMCF